MPCLPPLAGWADTPTCPAAREERLEEFRRLLKKADLPAALEKQINDLQSQFPPGTPIRCRSSTNNEDLTGFNGAGLYDSYTHRADEGKLTRTVKQTWASLWNLRAFEERTFWTIDHMKAAVGVTVHPNTDDEISNGVALTRTDAGGEAITSTRRRERTSSPTPRAAPCPRRCSSAPLARTSST